ncbi:choice-of-anchor I domain-containing protein [Paenibacillus wulumuqiensis]|uniref:choice-of-anchor I domain-containing protein n=1 Tax=Paenibacillus wulumuqiensis TaxID=1567107 RepID=UPI00061905A5|nr:stalk domain-containing protein [Paenibacillus wulumuqiensis]
MIQWNSIHSKKLAKRLALLTTVAVLGGSLVSGGHSAAAAKADISLRTAVQNMQGKISWNGASQKAVVTAGGVTLSLRSGSTMAMLAGKPIRLDQAPVFRNGTLYVSEHTTGQLQQAVLAKQNQTGYTLAASFQMPSDKAEIASSTPDGKRLVVTEADEGSITILDIANIHKTKVAKTVSFHSLSAKAEVTSVAVMPDGKYALAVIRTGDNKNEANPGILAVVDLSSYKIAKTYPLGIGPDSIAISKDGTYAVIAIEDEELDPATEEFDYPNAKRPGSITIVQFNQANALDGTVTDLPVDLSGVKGAIYPHEPQPEYVAINEAGTTAAVTLQENNVIALVDLDSKQITRMFALGTTRHAADLKDDGNVSFADTMTGRYEPDGIAFTPDGQYVITANEGDLGKNEFKDGVKAGGRNIAVWDLQGNRIYDSGNLIDRAAAQAGLYPDDRSPNKGSEVENLTVSTVNGKPVLAAASERADAVLFFDIGNPAQPVYKGLIPTAGESPEGIHRVNGRNLFVSADESTGTISFYAPAK